MNWIEWKGEKVGSPLFTVCACVYSYVDDGSPIIAIIPRAFRYRDEWEFYEGDTRTTHTLSYVPRKVWGGKPGETKSINIYQPERGDKIFYCVPTLPDGDPFDLNDVKKHLYKGLAVVWTKFCLVNAV